MKHTWRWFGPEDLVSISDMRQAGVQGVVTALHHVPNGEVWTPDQIKQRQTLVSTMPDGSSSGFGWDVVESLPVSEAIKKQDGNWQEHITNYKQSITNLAAVGIDIICYNFMPILDWTRTDLKWQLDHGGTCMRFDLIDFVVFDIYILKRLDSKQDYNADILELAKERFEQKTATQLKTLEQSIICGLPGANQKLTAPDVQILLDQYARINADQLRRHHHQFLELVAPHADKLGVKLCCHPDDPPFPLLGLPRVVSTESDYASMLEAVALPANGVTLCSGSLGVRHDLDLPGMMSRMGDRVHFLHLRNIKRDSDTLPCSFYEAEHLDGETDMVALISTITKEEERRRTEGRADHNIPMRPDHGQDILDDLKRRTQPGYPAIGRLKGLAELRGIERTLTHSMFTQ